MKIDGAVTLSFAVLAAIQYGRPPSFSESNREIRVHDQFNPLTGETIGEVKIYKVLGEHQNAIPCGPFGDSSIDSYKIGDSDRRGTMPRRFITHLFLFVWLTLLGVEFAEKVGWFVFPDQAVDDSVDEAVVSLGVALKTAAPEVATAASVVFIDVLAVRLLAVMLEYAGDLVLSPQPMILGPPQVICKLHCTFLI